MKESNIHLTSYKELLPIENGWIKDLAAEVNKEYGRRNRVIIVSYEEGDTFKQIDLRLNKLLIEKLKSEGRSMIEIAKFLKNARGTLYKRLAKAKA
jgi:fructose-1,6-bisphosphatase/inositol monophosphatase family enzyme